MATQITDANFNQTINSGKVVLVDFWAAWCMPCKNLSPVVDQVSAEFNGRAIIGKMDVDSNKETASQYGIKSIPALLIFKDGKLVDRVTSFNKASIVAKLNQYL